MLNDLGYSLQAPRKRYEGTAHPDRNDQFEHIIRPPTASCSVANQ